LRKTSIQTRIVVPIVLIMVFVFGMAALAAARFVANTVESQVKVRISGLAEFISRAGFPLSEGTLKSMGDLLDVGLATVTSDGRLRQSNLTPRLAESLVRSAESLPSRSDSPSVIRRNLAGRDYLVASAPMHSGSDAVLLLIYDAAKLREAQWDSVWPILAAALIAVILANISGWYVAKSITRPLRKLADQTAQVASGDLSSHITVRTGDEIEQLSDDFNHMIESLRKYQEELLKQERLATLGAVAAGIAHEIRNPLTSMKMMAQMLLQKELSDSDRESLSVMLDEIERLQLTTGGLLDYARPVEPRPGSADAPKAVKEVLRLLDRQLAHRATNVTARFPEEELIASIDTNRLKQVTMNLILNALNAMPEGGKLDIEIRRSGQRAELVVTDSGRGIPESDMGRIFEPFYTSGPGGFGLGLAISKRFIEEAGGSISASSGSGGTTFVVDIPVAQNEKARDV